MEVSNRTTVALRRDHWNLLSDLLYSCFTLSRALGNVMNWTQSKTSPSFQSLFKMWEDELRKNIFWYGLVGMEKWIGHRRSINSYSVPGDAENQKHWTQGLFCFINMEQEGQHQTSRQVLSRAQLSYATGDGERHRASFLWWRFKLSEWPGYRTTWSQKLCEGRHFRHRHNQSLPVIIHRM